MITSMILTLVCNASPAVAFAPKKPLKVERTAAAYPWSFRRGTDTARETAMTTIEEIIHKAGFSAIPRDTALSTWSDHYAEPTYGRAPSRKTLLAYGRALKVDRVLYGSISWHTRSIWVNAGPKTISTATLTAYVLDIASGQVVYSRGGVVGRSDERASNLKIAAAVLFTPIVTAVSGGPATPREEKAVQIALALAYRSWVEKAQAQN